MFADKSHILVSTKKKKATEKAFALNTPHAPLSKDWYITGVVSGKHRDIYVTSDWGSFQLQPPYT